MQRSFDPSEARELDARSADGIDVRLLWQPSTDSVSLQVTDARTGEAFVVTVDGADALDAFRHPFRVRECRAHAQHARP